MATKKSTSSKKKTPKKNSKKKTTTAAAVKKPAKPVLVFHTTERYAMYGKHVDSSTTRKIELRHELEKHIATGKATLGSIVAAYGSGEAMLRVAKLAIRRIVDVAGVTGLPTVKNQTELWAPGKIWRDKLQKLAVSKPGTTVKLIGKIGHVSVMRKS